MSTSLSEEDKKILNIPVEITTKLEDLFRRYALSLREKNIDDMIKVHKVWKSRYPDKRFRQEYAKYLKLSS